MQRGSFKAAGATRLFLYLLSGLLASPLSSGADLTAPVWLVGNGFHTSLALRRSDFPLAATLIDDRRAGLVLIGWGARDFYRGRTNLSTFARAFCGSPSLLHVVPIRGAITSRFSHSDLVRLDLPRAQMARLVEQLDASFARNSAGGLRPQGRGYYADSCFFAGRESFYFPYMCNTWIALKLHRSGVPICVPVALAEPNLLEQAAKAGRTEARRRSPADAF